MVCSEKCIAYYCKSTLATLIHMFVWMFSDLSQSQNSHAVIKLWHFVTFQGLQSWNNTTLINMWLITLIMRCHVVMLHKYFENQEVSWFVEIAAARCLSHIWAMNALQYDCTSWSQVHKYSGVQNPFTSAFTSCRRYLKCVTGSPQDSVYAALHLH